MASTPTSARAGRNLPVAVAVGLALGAAVLVPLYTDKTVFVAVVALAACVGLVELVTSARPSTPGLALPPLLAGAVLMVVLAYLRGSSALVVGLLLTMLGVVGWTVLAAAGGAPAAADPLDRLRAVSVSMFAAVYVPFLASFCVLLTAPGDGPARVTTFVATVVCSDVGGYAAGVLFGRHPLAPSVSPKKSWEGLGGSLLACVVGAALLVTLLLHAPAWRGVVFGAVMALAAVLGDLGESLLKRDLGVKDMGHLLPGHGGVMDRLDSLLVAAPLAWLLLSALVPG
jgi:phosphatidate cytidylyltransferase